MGKRLSVILSVAALLLAGCESGATTTGATATMRLPYSSEVQFQADELARQAQALAVQETAVAAATREAQDIAMRATTDALAAQAQATRQVMDAAATQQAMDLEATRQAAALNATATAASLEATRITRDAEATATWEAATATMQAAVSAVEATAQAGQAIAAQATAQAVIRQEERERITQPFRTFGPWMLLLVGVLALVWIGYQLLPIVQARLGQIRRDERGDLPLVTLFQNGALMLFDPTRGWGPATRILDGDVTQPLLTAPEYQDGTTKRAPFVDWRKGGRPRPVVARPGAAPRSAQGSPSPSQWRDVTAAVERNWPSRVPLMGVLRALGGAISYRRLALGVTMDEDGRPQVVQADMSRLVHVAVGGSSGWGKSVFLQMLTCQLAQSSDPVDLALVDLEGVTFAPFARCGRLLYPIADTEQDTLALLQALTGELDRRKELYAQFPGVANLDQYNGQAPEPLAPTVVLFDEATALLEDKRVEGMIKTLVLRARKYGLWCVLGGQDWKASSLDTAIRNQLSSRFQFKAMSASQSRVLLQRSGAEHLDAPGRALALLPGRDMLELQAPMVGCQTIALELSDGGPRCALPEVAGGDDRRDSDEEAEVLRLKQEGASDTRIAREVFGHGNPHYIEKVRGILRQQHAGAV
jgi:hypothetical protein